MFDIIRTFPDLVHLVHDEVRDLQVPVYDPVCVKVVVVLPEGVDERLRHLEPPHVEEELEEGEDGHHQVDLVPGVALGRVKELAPHQGREQEGVDRQGHHLIRQK